MSPTLAHPPWLVHDEGGHLLSVVLSYEDYKRFLRLLADHADWETLPTHLRDAVDRLLAEEALAEPGPAQPLRDLMKDAGEIG